MRLILEWRNENMGTVSAMGGFIPGHRLDLLDVTQMFDDDFVGTDTVFCLGDADYYAWLLEESQTVPQGQSFLGRWVAEMGHEDDFCPSEPLATCDSLVGSADRQRQHARGHVSYLRSAHVLWQNRRRWGNRLSPETYAFYSPPAQRARTRCTDAL